MTKMVKCDCGASVNEAQLTHHINSQWHQKRELAISLRQRGLSFAEIARQLGLTRAYIGQKFAQEEKVTA